MNTNCLEGFKCPECGSYEPFMIALNTVGKVFDDGVAETFDNEWDNASWCQCCGCDHYGTVADFRPGDSQQEEFNVTIRRAEYREHIFRVTAANENVAHALALKAANDYDFHDTPVYRANEEVVSITKEN